ncbi:MAG: YqiJ family protein [Spirochaetes bacterium]|nr:YqiJ family protein [Spirochaetota bacterium]
MNGFIQLFKAAISLPNLPYTILLGVMLLYWFSVILGFFDIKSLDFDADTDIDLDVDVEMDLEADVDVETDADPGGSGIHFFSSILNMHKVPISVWFSVFIPVAWACSIMLNATLDVVSGNLIHNFFRLILGFIIIVPLAALVSRTVSIPLSKLFTYKKSTSASDMIHKICMITSTKVTPTFGTAEFKTDEGTPIILNVRGQKQNDLTKGSQAVITKYDKETNTYQVIPFQTNDDQNNL